MQTRRHAARTPTKTILFAGGGTGGHLFPGIAVAERLQSAGSAVRVVFVGSKRSLERDVLERSGYAHVPLPVEPVTTLRRNPFRFAWRNAHAMHVAARVLRRERPAVVVGLGGLASVPVVWAAPREGIPTVLLEQNSIPGRTTRWLSRRADLVCLSFDTSAARLPDRARLLVTGNPVRREIAALSAVEPASDASGANTLLVLGGSQGAVAVNDAVLACIERLRDRTARWSIAHQTGAADCRRVRDRYRALGVAAEVEPFFDDMVSRYRRATLVISRAGATTLAELACAGCPAVLIPYPHAADDHQRHNAHAFSVAGAARVVEQSGEIDRMSARLGEELSSLFHDERQRARMRDGMRRLARPLAAEEVARRVLALAGAERDMESAGGPHFPPACVPPLVVHNERDTNSFGTR